MADTLYAAYGGSNTTSNLYTVDTSTGALTSIGPIGFALTDLAVDPITNLLYGATNNNSTNNPRSIVVIDTDTGVGTLIGAEFASGTRNLIGIAFDSAGQMYGWIGPGGGAGTRNALATVNKTTGLATPVGASGIPGGTFGGGFDFDIADICYGTLDGGNGKVWTINLLTGAATGGATLSGTSNAWPNSGKFTTDKTVWWAVIRSDVGDPGELVTIDLATGVITTEAVMTLAENELDALAWFTPQVIPPPPPIDLGDVRAYPTVRVIGTNLVSRTLTVLDQRATNREILYTLNGPAYHTGQVASDDHITNQPFPTDADPPVISNNVRLIYILQRWPNATPPYQPIFGGILFTVEDQGSDAPTTRYTAFDPWQLMMSRPVRDPDTGDLPGVDGLKFPPNSRASDIALALLDTSETFDGESHIDFSDTGLVDDTDPLPYGIKFDEGSTVGDAWQQLVDTGTIDIVLTPMYEPITAPGKVVRFNTSPSYGSTRYSAIMGWDTAGHGVAQMSRMVDGTRLANRIIYYAGQGGIPTPLQADAASIAQYGIYYAQQFFPGTLDRQRVELLAFADLQIRKDGARSITLDVAPERSLLAVRDYWLGDYVPVWASRNLRDPLGIDYDTFDPDFPYASGYQRIYAIPLTIDDNGVTRVSAMVTSRDVAVTS